MLRDDVIQVGDEHLVICQDVLAVGELLLIGVELFGKLVEFLFARLQFAALPDGILQRKEAHLHIIHALRSCLFVGHAPDLVFIGKLFIAIVNAGIRNVAMRTGRLPTVGRIFRRAGRSARRLLRARIAEVDGRQLDFARAIGAHGNGDIAVCHDVPSCRRYSARV